MRGPSPSRSLLGSESSSAEAPIRPLLASDTARTAGMGLPKASLVILAFAVLFARLQGLAPKRWRARSDCEFVRRAVAASPRATCKYRVSAAITYAGVATPLWFRLVYRNRYFELFDVLPDASARQPTS